MTFLQVVHLQYAVFQNESVRSIEELRRLDMERFLHTVEPFVKEIVKQESGAEAVFVYVTKLQCATPQLQHLQLCPRDKVTHLCDKIAR